MEGIALLMGIDGMGRIMINSLCLLSSVPSTLLFAIIKVFGIAK